MPQHAERKHGYTPPRSIDGAMPFLAMFSERADPWTLVGDYDESADVWTVDGQPLATVDNVALETITFTKSGGESQDRD